MEHLLVLILTAAVGYLLKTKVIFVEYGFRVSRQQSSSAVGGKAAGQQTPGGVRRPVVLSDSGVTKALEAARRSAETQLTSALVNLGCKRPKALEVAKTAMTKEGDFDTKLLWAIQNAA